jgi:hypothetical protein
LADTKNDFAGLATPGAIARMMNDQAFVPQAGQYKGTIFVRTEPESGFYQMSRQSSDFGYFGATALSHEQVHKFGGGEFPAYQRQLDVLGGFRNSIQSPELYHYWQNLIQGGINANQPH